MRGRSMQGLACQREELTLLHKPGPPRIREILKLLDDSGARFIIVGSVAAQLHGVQLEPGDLDIVPAQDTENLERLIHVLHALEARPAGPFGEWTTLPNGEKKWIERDTTEEELRAWTPNARDISSLDHRFRSRLGDFDVVPEVTGHYALLKARAVQIQAYGLQLWVAHIDELLGRLTVPRREKDLAQVAQLREIQRTRGAT